VVLEKVNMTHSFDDQVVVPNLMRQLDMLGTAQGESSVSQTGRYFDAPDIDISVYDTIVLCMSGGKDGIASLLQLIEMGVDMSKVELWHQDVDGREGSTLFDWAFMADYNRKLAEAFDLKLFFRGLKVAWKVRC
jgi:hypothetical protein